jgi:tRNA(fMet)-specific endonuclease VapC
MKDDPGAMSHAQSCRPGELFMVPPVLAEVLYGIARLPDPSARRRLYEGELERWRSVLRWLDWSEEASDLFGREKARLEARGQRIEDMDLAIAAIALAHGHPLATFNARHFGRVAGLTVQDWSRAPD